MATCVGQLVEQQAALGLRVMVASPEEGDLAPLAKRVGVLHVAWEATRSPGPAVVDETRRLARIVDDLSPDVVHLHSSKAGLAGRLAVRGHRPTLFQPNGWSFEAATGLQRRGAVAWERLGARWTSMIVCVSESERQRGVDQGIVASWHVVPNGIDLDAFPYADPAARPAARAGLDLDEAAPLVVCVGRLTRQKGQDLLLDSWQHVLDRVPEATLVFVGDGPGRASLERRGVPRAAFMGERRDVVDWLAAADVVALPSRWEGMALTMLEAMARGRSVVATDVSGAREALAGEAGAVVPREDRRALAEAVAARLLDPSLADAEGQAGRALAERFHDVRRTAAAVTGLYASVYE